MKRKFLLLIVMILLISISYLYFFIISPVFVKKPELEKPVFTGKVEEKHIEWVVNELGAYKLQENSEIEVSVNREKFTVKVMNNKPIVKKGEAEDPDIRIYASPEAFQRIFNSEDFKKELINLYREGKIKIEVLKPPEELILKGYKAIYDELQR